MAGGKNGGGLGAAKKKQYSKRNVEETKIGKKG